MTWTSPEPPSALGPADAPTASPAEWLGKHARLTGAGVTLVFADGSAARIDGLLPEAASFGNLVARLRAAG